MTDMAAQCATDMLNNPLWDYALKVYAKPGVAAELLRLQDDYHADVLWLLTALWLGGRGVSLTTDDLDQNRYHACREQQILPCRARRRACDKQSDPALYASLKQAELDAEQQGLALLFTAFQQRQADGGNAAANLSVLTPHAEHLLRLTEACSG